MQPERRSLTRSLSDIDRSTAAEAMSDRLLKAGLGLELPDHVVQAVLMQGGYRQEL